MRDQFIADQQISYFVLVTVIVLVIDSVPITSRSRSKRVNRQSACEPCSSIYRLQSLSMGSQPAFALLRRGRRLVLKKLGWWNGRHVRLRGVCRKACGFKSRPEHHPSEDWSSFGDVSLRPRDQNFVSLVKSCFETGRARRLNLYTSLATAACGRASPPASSPEQAAV